MLLVQKWINAGRGGPGGGWVLAELPVLRSELIFSSTHSPLRSAVIIIYLRLLLKAFKCIWPLLSQSNNCFLLILSPALTIAPPDTWCLEPLLRLFCRARGLIWASAVGRWEMWCRLGLGWSNRLDFRPAVCLWITKAERDVLCSLWLGIIIAAVMWSASLHLWKKSA